MPNIERRRFSIDNREFEGIPSLNEITMLGRRMVPEELLACLDDDCQVRLVDIRGNTVYAHLAFLPVKCGSASHEILCVIPHHFSKKLPAVLAKKHWDLFGNDTPASR